MTDSQSGRSDERTLAATGVTLLALLVNIGLTIGFGLHAGIWWRIAAAILVPIALVLLIAVGSRRGDVLVRLTRWATRYGEKPLQSR